MAPPRITYDRHGTPAVWADDAGSAYFGIGFLHGLHRPLQMLIIATAGRGELARRLAPRRDLVALDALAARLDIPARAGAEVERLPPHARSWLDAYIAGCAAGLGRGGLPFELRLLVARLPRPCRESVLGGLLLAAYLGLAEGQERMERALVDAVAAGADPALLEAMFQPHLDGWQPALLAPIARRGRLGFASHGLIRGPGGSNAWAVTGERTESGNPLFAGDPHLQVNQMPALLFELRARVGDDCWLGATIPGLPGIAVGRNRRLAWSGTFAVADNVDFTIEQVDARGALRPQAGHAPVIEREVEVRRRFGAAQRLRFYATDRGVLETDDPTSGPSLAARWAGLHGAAKGLAAYMALPLATSVEEAEVVLRDAGTFSLHFVLADRGGDVRYVQAGRIPKRSGGWSGLYPVRGEDGERRWLGFYEGAGLPRALPQAGVVASANEGRPAPDGATLATLAQPEYRRARIEAVLRAQPRHDLLGMRRLQLDLFSLQAERLRPLFLEALPPGALREALASWDLRYEPDRCGANAFELAYAAARLGLAPELGNGWFETMLEQSELAVWWCSGIDRVLADPGSWAGGRGERLRARLALVAAEKPSPLGDVQRFDMPHMILGGLPCGGLDRGPYALPGSRATVCQGAITRPGGRTLVTAPAYRFVCDLGEDGALSSLPGGIDGSRFSGSYDRWLSDYLAGEYHPLVPPAPGEQELSRDLVGRLEVSRV